MPELFWAKELSIGLSIYFVIKLLNSTYGLLVEREKMVRLGN